MGNEQSAGGGGGEAAVDTGGMVAEWTKMSPVSPPTARDGHVMVTHGDKVYLFGGMAQPTPSEFVELDDLHVYDATTGRWSEVPKTAGAVWPAARANGTAAVVGDKLFLFGGMNMTTGGFLGDMYTLDLQTMLWAAVEVNGTLPSPRDKLKCAAAGDRIIFFGGFGPAPEVEADDDEEEEEEEHAQFTWFADIHVFNPATNECTAVMPTGFGPTARAAHAMCSIPTTGGVAVFGGRDRSGRRDDLYFLEQDGAQWNWTSKIDAKGSAPGLVSFHSLTAFDNKLLVLGGRNAINDHVSDINAFDLATDSWVQPALAATSEKHCRGAHAVCVVGGALFAFGGSSNYNPDMQCCTTFYGDTFQLKLDTASPAPAPVAEVVATVPETKKRSLPTDAERPEETPKREGKVARHEVL